MPDHRARLAAIKRFDQLVAYLRDDMGWPIEGDDFEEITFDYTPEELGIDAASRAKIQEIKRLRPLAANQPWGIFFVKFEPKRLPVIALRRILSRVVIKKRAAANSAERAAWNLADLLFISNYGDDAERRISFAHFVQDDHWGDLPILRVLGWNGDDTNLHLDHVAHELTSKLCWPDDESDVDGWRSAWADAFTLRHREVIATSKHLAERLADLARETRKKANAALAIESPNGPLRTLMDAFKKALIHDLDEDGFADMYAQTVAYGLLSARISRPEGLVADNMADMVPVTNPFLKEMLESFLRLGGRHRTGQGWTGIDFDELGINEIVQLLREANMEAVLRDFGDRNPQEDPVIHFYEHFLKEYDAKKRMQRGVFYTPRPVVSYIVRSVHELLQTEFGLADGLADTATWGEILEKHPALKLPPLSDSPGETQTISPNEPFVQILDPATGTATFLVEVIEVIYRTLQAKWKGQRLSDAQQIAAWNDYVPRHLLSRLHGYELMMAPYAIAHMKIGLKLAETGYRFGSEERARIYLTNALEPWLRQLPLVGFNALAHEAQSVNEIKRAKRFTVVIGNPPYNNRSDNKTDWIMRLIGCYKVTVRVEETQIQALSDDYVKFLRLADWSIGLSGAGAVGMITNNGFLDGHIFRDFRRHLADEFEWAWLVNLHGDSRKKEMAPDGNSDKNVFDIMQGVSLSIFAMRKGVGLTRQILYQDVWGSREYKYQLLLSGLPESGWTSIPRGAAQKSLVPVRVASEDWELAQPLAECFGTGKWLVDKTYSYGSGFKSQQDEFAIAFDRDSLVANVKTLLRPDMTELTLRKQFSLCKTNQWNFQRARERLSRWDWEKAIQRVLFRPFDFRFTIISADIVTNPRREIMAQLERPNFGLLATRKATEGFSIFATRVPCGHKIVGNYDMTIVFPLYRYAVADDSHLPFSDGKKELNFAIGFLKVLADSLQLPFESGAILGLTPEDIFRYIYGVFHSPAYRSRYAEFLKNDFPRLPLTGNIALFRALAQHGGELVALHLLESPILDQPMTEYIGNRNPEVERPPTWSKDTVWVDKRQTSGFKGVPEEVWNFRIGGYRVCYQWLKDRKGRTLSDGDIAHYHKIVVALNETIRLMQEIDAVIDQHGGWPGAFAMDTGEQA